MEEGVLDSNGQTWYSKESSAIPKGLWNVAEKISEGLGNSSVRAWACSKCGKVELSLKNG